MLLQGQHTLPEVLAVVESQDAAVKARYSTNADTPQNKLAIKAEQNFNAALAEFIKKVTKGYKGVPTGGMVLDYDVTPHSVRVALQFSASEDRTVVDQGVKSKKTKRSKPKAQAPTPEPANRTKGATKTSIERSSTAPQTSNEDKP